MHLTPAEQIILKSFLVNPVEAEAVKLKYLAAHVTDWDELADTGISLGVGPLVYHALNDGGLKELIPNGAFDRLQQCYYVTLRRSMLLYGVFEQAVRGLQAAGIQVVALKGIYLSEHLYGDIGLRQVSDIDLLVSAEEGGKSIEVLSELGFRSTENPFSSHLTPDPDFIHYPPMVKDGFSVEIHVRLHRPHPDYCINTSAFIARAVPVVISGENVYTLSFYDHLIFLCIHSEKHFTGSKIQFTCFADIANILTSHKDEIDWSMLKQQCISNKCEAVVMKHILLVHHFFNVPVPDFILQRSASLLKKEDKETFIRFLRGYMFTGNHIDMFSGNIGKIEGFRNKVEFIAGNLFPPKGYMISRYNIKHKLLYFLWYFYRFRIVAGSLIGKVVGRTKWVKR